MIFEIVSKQKTAMKALFSILIIGGFFYVSGSFFVPVVLGSVISIVAFPIVQKLEKRGWRKGLSAFTVTLGITLAVLIPSASLLVIGGQTAFNQLKALRLGEEGSIENLAYSPTFRRAVTSITDVFGLPRNTLLQGARHILVDAADFFSKFFSDIIYQLPETIIGLVAIVLAVYYALTDGHRVVSFFRANSPFDEASTEKIFAAIRDGSYSVIVATFFSALAQMFVMTLGVWLTGTPNVTLIGLFTFLFSFLPILGTTPISIAVIVYDFTLGRTTEGLVMIVVALIVSFVDNVVHLVVLKKRANIHPLIGFITVFGGLKVLGFGGIFIGPVVALIAMELGPILIREQRRNPSSATIAVTPDEIKLHHRPS